MPYGERGNGIHRWDVQYSEKISADQTKDIRAAWDENKDRKYQIDGAQCATVTNDCVVKRGGANLGEFRTPKGAGTSAMNAEQGTTTLWTRGSAAESREGKMHTVDNQRHQPISCGASDPR